MPFRRACLVTAAALLAFACAGCSGSDDDAPASAASGGPAVLVPGKPGEANKTLSPQEAARQRAEDDTPNSADVTYAQMMIVHHAQALTMTQLVAERAESASVKGLSARIAAAQEPEIEAMKAWLKSYGKPTEASGHTGHTTMAGMATEAQLEQLRAARGKAFDQFFLTLMITHHQGAITMAGEVKAQGNNIRVEEMADDVVAQQTSEISRMRGMLDG